MYTDFKLLIYIFFLSQRIALNLYSKEYKGNVITLKVRYSDFETITKRVTLKKYTSAIFDIYKSSVELLKDLDPVKKKIRLIGISVNNLKPYSLLGNLLFKDERKDENLTKAIEKISDKFGEDKLTIAGITDEES